ncbi:hypothetical protein E6O51_01080 [Pseudothauera rhizosphaerae]|uniref:Fido domain-containing protein n=1 Tax=Pseudothauera rhizosphaerae TaxID=2565932 RepID=A0A4S4B0R0_9RHOO|nr:hypothetical protein E6O51_01080 [Pseudothauera rhizosphaerae]
MPSLPPWSSRRTGCATSIAALPATCSPIGPGVSARPPCKSALIPHRPPTTCPCACGTSASTLKSGCGMSITPNPSRNYSFAWADWRFQWIHPFKDFNGRVGRILLVALAFRLGLPPMDPAGNARKRQKYFEALRTADAGDLRPLAAIWLGRL